MSVALAAALTLGGLACELGGDLAWDSGQPGPDPILPRDAGPGPGPGLEDAGPGREDAGKPPQNVDGGRSPDGGTAPDAGGDTDGSGCIVGGWPAADPSKAGPFTVVVENNVGPAAGIVENGTQPHFTVIRPTDLAQGGRCHPVITWGNGHGDNPPTYMVLLKQLASHGFVVVASLTRNASQGDPPPMKVGIDWVLQQNEDPTSAMYHHIDTTHVGATGHSEGGAATSKLGSDPRITAIATICGAAANSNMHGPALLLCGGQDTVATCDRMKTAFDGISQPVMLANQLTATHGSWIGSIKDPFMIAVTGWMRLHLMGDSSLRKMFYGASCDLCTNTKVWKIQQKTMDQ